MSVVFGSAERAAARSLIALAIAEDLASPGDVTSAAVIPSDVVASASVVARRPGVAAGLAIAPLVLSAVDSRLVWTSLIPDGEAVAPGTVAGRISGPYRSVLAAERTVLNFLGPLSGTATLTRAFSDRVRGASARILDTRKTLPGWRLLQKYAVRCGGGLNHRIGLYDAVLVKDNHLACWTATQPLSQLVSTARKSAPAEYVIQVEVDSVAQLRELLAPVDRFHLPDMVLLDNMSLDELRASVALRNERAPFVLLEASGGVTLDTVGDIARTGVDRISVGALTHSAPALDFGLDWDAPPSE